MSSTRKLWLGLTALLEASFAVLLSVGTEIHRQMPPIPSSVVTTQGEVVFTRADIEKGRQVWQSIGGHQLGSIWGHGSYVAPDWTADWLHRETEAWLDLRSQAVSGTRYAELDPGLQAAEQARLKPLIRANTYDTDRDVVTVAPERAAAIARAADQYVRLFGDHPDFVELPRAYASGL